MFPLSSMTSFCRRRLLDSDSAADASRVATRDTRRERALRSSPPVAFGVV